MSHTARVVVPRAQANLDTFDPQPLARYLTQEGDTIPRLVEWFYGVSGAKHRDLVNLVAATNELRSSAALPAGILVIIPQPGWRTML